MSDKERWALILGASSGFGAACTRALAALLLGGAMIGCTAQPSAPAGATPSPSAGSTVPRGGTLRVVVPQKAQEVQGGFDPGAPGFLDPQLDYSRGGVELARCCLSRTLYSHNGRSTEEGGARPQPDLAASMPEVSADGLVWTIHIKPGLHYGPPLQAVEITAADFIRSFHRLLSPAVGGPLAWDFIDIVGAPDYNAGKAVMISGLEAPDAHTLVIRLTRAEGDFAARLAETYTAPLPADPGHPEAPFGIADGADTGFGRFVVSSGPYMLLGAEALDFSVPAAERRPVAGVGPGKVTLVRNPSWKADSDALRPAYVDRLEIVVVDSMSAAVAALDGGTADLVWNPRTPPTIPADTYQAFQSDPARGQARVDRASVVRALVMNLAVPPFDDIHVRKALNLALDKQALVDLQGGPSAAEPVGHIAPDSSEDGLLLDYDPYGTPGHRGDLAAARAEMALATDYDTNGDGVCDAPVCAHVRATTREPFTATARKAAEDFRALGINLEVEVQDMNTFFQGAADPRAKIAMVIGIGFFNGYITAYGTLGVFDSPWAISGDSANGTLVGATAEQLQAWGYEGAEVPPNVDDRIEACIPLVGSAQFPCWAAADQYLMENVVPWVPYSQDRQVALTSPRVLAYGYDELAGTTSLDQIALKP